MENISRSINIVLNAVALGMRVVSTILEVIPGAADTGTQVTLLSIGLPTLALAALQKKG